MAAPNGVTVVVAEELLGPSRALEIEICQGDRCATASEPLTRGPGSGRGPAVLEVGFPDFAAEFDAGAADLALAVRDGDRVVRRLDTTTDLERMHPNGRRCDGDGFLSGRARDRLR